MTEHSDHPLPAGPSPDIDAQLQRELDEALGDKTVEQLMEESTATPSEPSSETPAANADADSPQRFIHDMVRARIAAIRGDDVFVEITGLGGKHQGLVPLTQFDRPPRLGSIMDFVVQRVDEAEGLIILSREGAVSRATWEQLQRGAVVEARVVATNKGGLELEMVGGIRAFMPASQVDMHHIDDLSTMVGQKLQGMVQEIDRKSKKVVMSRRHLLEQERVAKQAKAWDELEPGQLRDGKVSSLMEYGAFVDLGGIDGLIHVSDLSYSRVAKPSDLLKVGQDIKVKILKIDKDKKRISLGLKQVAPDPWDTVASSLKVKDQVTGKVVRIADFGAFVEVLPGVEGLLPVSEMGWKRIAKPTEVVKEGDSVRLVILSLDLEKRRLSLSLKQAGGDPWIGAEHKFAKHALVDAKVLSITDFGAFFELEPGVEGLVHISELADRRINAVTDVVKVGEVHKVRVLEVDETNHRIRLSIKAVNKEPVEEAKPAAVAQSAATPAKPVTAAAAAKKKSSKSLKSGLGANAALGMGLGDLKL